MVLHGGTGSAGRLEANKRRDKSRASRVAARGRLKPVVGKFHVDTAKAQNSAKAQQLWKPPLAFLRPCCVFAVSSVT